MTPAALALEALHHDENRLALRLQRMADKHAADHEIVHVARDLLRWTEEHVRRVADAGTQHGLGLDAEPDRTSDLASTVRRVGGELMGRRHAPALMLLEDLKDLHADAGRVQLDWIVLDQVAKATKDTALQELAESCLPEAKRQVTWAQTKLKELAPQALAST